MINGCGTPASGASGNVHVSCARSPGRWSASQTNSTLRRAPSRSGCETLITSPTPATEATRPARSTRYESSAKPRSRWCAEQAREWIVGLDDRDLSMFALGLYAGEGAKTGGTVAMANTNPTYLLVFITWLRRAFEIDESRLRVHLYLHEGLDLPAAVRYWSELLEIPPEQFTKPYRAVADASIRRSKHVYGCPSVRYASTPLKRRVMALIEALVSGFVNPG